MRSERSVGEWVWRRWSNRRVREWAVTQVKRRICWKMKCDVGEVTECLENEQSSFSKLWVTSPTSQLIHHPFRRFTSFSNPSVASPTSQFILQPFFRFSYVTGSFSKISASSPRPQLILHSFSRFTYVTAHFRTLLLLHLRHSSFSNPSVAPPTSQFILQSFFRFSYVTGSSLTSPGESPTF